MIPDYLYDEEELAILERRLATVSDPSRQVEPTPEGREYRRDLEAHIEELRARVEGRDAYPLDDPHHPDFHETMADAYDMREKAAGL